MTGTTEAKPAATIPDPAHGGGLTVLLLEDTEPVRRTVAGQLELLGYTVVPVSNGAQALEMLGGRLRIDILLPDVVMPGEISGIEVAYEAQRMRPDLRILCMSGFTDVEGATEKLALGRIPLISKPFTKMQLAQALARLGAAEQTSP
jgi:CheY-like chemotaxis protein